jgi:hypothetical protein
MVAAPGSEANHCRFSLPPLGAFQRMTDWRPGFYFSGGSQVAVTNPQALPA